jgi:hypothetical protein
MNTGSRPGGVMGINRAVLIITKSRLCLNIDRLFSDYMIFDDQAESNV